MGRSDDRPKKKKKSGKGRDGSESMGKVNSDASEMIQDEYLLAERKHREAVERSQMSKRGNRSSEWQKAILSSGTSSDKLAALTVRVQEDPILNLQALESLVELAEKKGVRQSTEALENLRHLCIGYLLPNRKLRTFQESVKLSSDHSASSLINWFFEEKLKALYGRYVRALDDVSRHGLEFAKLKAMKIIQQLLIAKPEQEKLLLWCLANKLGDPSRKVASQASFLLSDVLQKHPNMRKIVIMEVRSALFSGSASISAQYYGLAFLNQILLPKDDPELANGLIQVYMTAFSLSKSGEDPDERLLGVILTGINRALPYSELGEESFDAHIDDLFKHVHISGFSTSVQALILLFNILSKRTDLSDRFYKVIYQRLMAPDIVSSGKQTVFLNLLYKVLQQDSRSERVRAFVKRVLQTCHMHGVPFTCGCLILISEVLKKKPELWKAVNGTEGEKSDESLEAGATGDGDRLQCVSYDARARDPRYAHADASPWWELVSLTCHFHPSVRMFAKSLLKGESIRYDGNPLVDFTLTRFLDRFIARNPKKKKQTQLHAHASAAASATPFVESEACFVRFFAEKDRRMQSIARKKDKERDKRERRKRKRRKTVDDEDSDDKSMDGDEGDDLSELDDDALSGEEGSSLDEGDSEEESTLGFSSAFSAAENYSEQIEGRSRGKWLRKEGETSRDKSATQHGRHANKGKELPRKRPKHR